MHLKFSGEMWFWKGPAPFHFITVPEAQSDSLSEVAPLVTYGWGMVPITALIGGTEWTTALFPKDGLYVLPIKVAVQRAESLKLGDIIDVDLSVSV